MILIKQKSFSPSWCFSSLAATANHRTNSAFSGRSVIYFRIKDLKASSGSDIQVWGSSELIQLLLKNDLVDELWLMIHPLTLGKGKKLFVDGPIPAAFTLAESAVTPSGVIIANYKRAGEVKTGTVGV